MNVVTSLGSEKARAILATLILSLNQSYGARFFDSETAHQGLNWRAVFLTLMLNIALLSVIVINFFDSPSSTALSKQSVINVFDVSGPQKVQTVAVKDTAAVIIPKPVVRVVLDIKKIAIQPVTQVSTLNQSTSGIKCGIAESVGFAIENDETLRSDVAILGASVKSVSNAVMIWDGEWVPIQSITSDVPLERVKQGLVNTIATADPDCLTEPLSGPRFIFVKNSVSELSPPETLVLVVGSGLWTWDDILSKNRDLIDIYKNGDEANIIQSTFNTEKSYNKKET